MIILKNYILITNILFFAIFFSCTNANSDKITDKLAEENEPKDTTDFKWVEGVFEYTAGANVYRETWKKKSDTLFVCEGYYFSKSDTLFAMTIKLQKNNDALKMIYNVKGQNDGKDVEYSLSSHRNNIYVFENPFKIFPSLMQYKFIGDSIIEVKEKGFVNDKEKVQEYVVTKVKENLMF